MAKMTITWKSVIKLNTGCGLHTSKKGHFILVTLWCGRTVTTNFSQMHGLKKFSYPWCPVRARESSAIRHLHVSHNAPYLPPKILHTHYFHFLLGRL